VNTRLVATTMSSHPEAVAARLAHPPDGIDYLELRLDALEQPSAATVSRLMALPRSVPLVVTCRSVAQGGRYAGDEAGRLALLDLAARAGADLLDVEDTALGALPPDLPGRRIASCHLTRFVPRLTALARRLLAHGTAFAKLAVPADTPRQLAELMVLQGTFAGRLAVVPTGRLAEAGRVMAAACGSPLTYGALDEHAKGHPDQPDAARLHAVHNVSSLPPGTRFFGVVGRPIAHSMSPAYHNTVFRGVAHGARLLPFDIDHLEDLLREADALRLDGLAVTHPFKQDAVRLADSVLPGARSTGAANTLMRTPTGWQARNTDWKAACDLLPRLLDGWLRGQRGELTRERWLASALEGCQRAGGSKRCKREADDPRPQVLLLGAGGAARALAVALYEEPVDLNIWSRRLSHARNLADDLLTEHGAHVLADPGEQPADIVLNATPVGMPGIDVAELSGFGPRCFRPGGLLLDLTYGSGPSPLREAAHAAGVPIVGGEFFFGLQARRQAEVFTGGSLAPALIQRAAAACGANEATHGA